MKILKFIFLVVLLSGSIDASAAYCIKSTSNYNEYVRCMHTWYSNHQILDKASYDALKGIKETNVNTQQSVNANCEEQVKELQEQLEEYKEIIKLQKDQIDYLKSRVKDNEETKKDN